MSEVVLHLLGPFEWPGLGPRWARVYAPSARKNGPLPVLCLFDGQNIFHDAPSFVGGWQLHKTVSRMEKRGERAPLVLGIDHGGHERILELSPFSTHGAEGRLPRLMDLVSERILPLVQQTFGASTRAADTAIGGSSMGGLAALWAHLQMPERFGMAMAMSPSLQIGHGAIFDWIAQKRMPAASRLYLDAGGREAKGALLAATSRLATGLKQQGYDARSLRFVAARSGSHDEKSWRRRAPGAIRFLFQGG